MNEFHKRLAKVLPHGAIKFVFSDAEMLDNLIIFRNHEKMDAARKFINDVERVFPGAKMVVIHNPFTTSVP